jgi:hypothetical protein
METQDISKPNRLYIISTIAFIFVLPVSGICVEMFRGQPISVELAGKWFVFSSVGLRLFVAGLKQVKDPAFTAGQIFHISDIKSFAIIRELGFANISFGLVGIISLFLPQWRIVSAFSSGLYYGIAGLQHILKKPAGSNEKFALVTDVFVFLLLLAYCLYVCGIVKL